MKLDIVISLDHIGFFGGGGIFKAISVGRATPWGAWNILA